MNKMLISNRCISGLMSNLIKKSLMVSTVYVVLIKSTNLQEIRQSMSKLYGRKLVPFLSPMLEDDLGKKVPVEVGNKIHERNFNKIKECIDMVAQHVNPGDRAIAIKLTAFMPIELLVCFSPSLFFLMQMR